MTMVWASMLGSSAASAYGRAGRVKGIACSWAFGVRFMSAAEAAEGPSEATAPRPAIAPRRKSLRSGFGVIRSAR
jgi:hypothetical protein